jgi:hypothetical protein
MAGLRILKTALVPLMVWLITPLTAVLLPATAIADEPPSPELLEFLGNWETSEGEWQDPLELMKELDVVEADAQTVKVEDSRDGQ